MFKFVAMLGLVVSLASNCLGQTTFPSTTTLYAGSFVGSTLAQYDYQATLRAPTPVNFVLQPNGACQITSGTGVFLKNATYVIVSPTQIDVTLSPGQGQTPNMTVVYRFWQIPGTTNWYGFALFNGRATYVMRAHF